MARKMLENAIKDAARLRSRECANMISDAYRMAELGITVEDVADYAFLCELLLAPFQPYSDEQDIADAEADSYDELAYAAARSRDEERCRAIHLTNVRDRDDYPKNRELIVSTIAAIEAAVNKLATLKLLGASRQQLSAAQAQLRLVLEYFHLVSNKIGLIYDYENFYSSFEDGDVDNTAMMEDFATLKVQSDNDLEVFRERNANNPTFLAFIQEGKPKKV
ncbi:hypothetical protein IKD60_01740 [Candidatus Saccharibacteria bacterium]|nr:hypothetical protein [Candidatus Saccharibacteria bacterium]